MPSSYGASHQAGGTGAQTAKPRDSKCHEGGKGLKWVVADGVHPWARTLPLLLHPHPRGCPVPWPSAYPTSEGKAMPTAEANTCLKDSDEAEKEGGRFSQRNRLVKRPAYWRGCVWGHLER